MSTARVSGVGAGSVPARAALTVEPVARATALPPALLVLVGGVLAALTPLVGVVHTYDGSAVHAWTIAGWAAVLPGLLALILALTVPAAGLAAAAGAGAVGGARFVMDLPVLVDPGSIARPELFVETTARAEPFRAAGGGYLLLVADLVMLAGGVLGAVWLARAVSPAEFGPPVGVGRSSDRRVGPEPAPGSDRDAADPNGAGTSADESGSLVVLPERPRRRNNLMLTVGFLGVLLILGGTLPVPYTGGYLLERFVPVGGDVIGTLGVILLAGVGAVAVLCAVQLPRYLAVGLLAGTALAGAVPALVAVVTVLAGAPVALGGAVWFALAGAVLLGASGGLSQVRLVSVRADDWSARPGSRVWVGALGLVAAGLSAAAAVLPTLHVDGRAEVVQDGVLAQDAALPIVFVGAAVLLGLGALLTLVPATAAVGRPVVMVAVGGSAFAVTRSLATLTVLIAGTRQTAMLGIVTPRTWSAGPGLWCGVGATLFAAAAAVLARLDDRRVAGDALEVADDDAMADSRRRRGLLAVGVAVFTVVVLCLPTYRTPQGASATLLGGFALDTWGVWALLAVTVGALLYATVDGRPSVVGAFPTAAAAVVATRLLVPDSVRSGPNVTTAAGTVWTWVLVAVLVVAAAVMVVVADRVPRAVTPALDLGAAAGPGPRRPPGGGAKRSAGAKVGAPTRPERQAPMNRPIRVVVAKPGLDGHDRGVKVVARALRDAGMEVIYTGLHQTPEQIVAAALAEDADAVGLSVLSGAHMTQFRRVVELLNEADANDIVVFGGGIIPDADRAALAELGVTGIFTPGTPTSDIVDWLASAVTEQG